MGIWIAVISCKEMIAYQTAKQNIDRILNIGPEKKKQKEPER